MTAVPSRMGAGDLAGVMVVFDWNGTVMADVDRAVAATSAVLADHGIEPLAREDFRAGFRLPLAEWLASLGAPGAETAWNVAMAARSARARPEAGAALAALHGRGALVAVVSAAGTDAVATDLTATGLALCIAQVWTGVTDKAIQLGKDRGLRPRAIYVRDTEYDIVPAQRAGFTDRYRRA